MSAYQIVTRAGWQTIINDVFLDEKGPWVLFRSTNNSGLELLRVNSSEVLYIAKLDIEATDA